MEDKAEYIKMTADIVSAYVSNNSLSPHEVPNLIRSIHETVTGVSNGGLKTWSKEQSPAVPIKKSVSPDYIICLEDGKKFKSLRRHLRTHYDLTPEAYRSKWGLGNDYPMVAPNYAKTRSALARDMGLGQKRTGAHRPRRGT
jgi:predicted transcriptional regulator